MFTEDYLLHNVLVRGEVSNCKYHASGHIYFTLKDASGTLSCVMFAGRRRGLSFHMQNGDQVIVAGAVDVYAKTGSYQLYANQIIRDGVAVEISPDSRGRSLYLVVGMEGVTEIEVSTPTTSGGCIHADGSPLKKGEKLWLEQADSLAGVSIIARDKYGEILWMADFPKNEDSEHYIIDDWIITVE
jgi:hypothetical protein